MVLEPAKRGESIKPGAVSPRRIANSYLAREVGGSGNKQDIIDVTLRSNKIIHLLPPVSRAAQFYNRYLWGSASLHPRLYAFSPFHGL